MDSDNFLNNIKITFSTIRIIKYLNFYDIYSQNMRICVTYVVLECIRMSSKLHVFTILRGRQCSEYVDISQIAALIFGKRYKF